MNYYQEILAKISEAVDQKDYDLARSLISSELNAPYIPREVEEKLLEYQDLLKTDRNFVISDEQLEEYLFGRDEYQLLAVDELNKKNLRDYIGLCERYFASDGNHNAQALLIDSLIRQEIHYLFKLKDQEFDPAESVSAENSEGYKKAAAILEEEYLKDPSRLILAKQLAYKEAMLTLPHNLNEEEGKALAQKIISYVDDAFERVPESAN